MDKPAPFLVNIMGPIASGKSSVITLLAQPPRLAVVIPEDLELWNHSSTGEAGLFEEFLTSKGNSALALQTLITCNFLHSDARVEMLTADRWAKYVWQLGGTRPLLHKHIFVFQERSIGEAVNVFTPLQLLSQVEKDLLVQIGNDVEKRIRKPNLQIFLEIAPEVSMSRCRIRGRKGENMYSFEYMQQLHEKYSKYAQKLINEGERVVVINSEYASVEEVAEQVKIEIEKLRHF